MVKEMEETFEESVSGELGLFTEEMGDNEEEEEEEEIEVETEEEVDDRGKELNRFRRLKVG
jgi:hypothetical protein